MHRLSAMSLGLCLCVLTAATLMSQENSRPNWQEWGFLIGEWTGTGSGQPGQGTGGFSFKPDLQQRVLVRTSRAEYPATKERPAYKHEDLMVIYYEAADSSARAVYFDNEGHVIHYAVQLDPANKTATFLSESEAGAPRYRLSYTGKPPDAVNIKFELAAPDKPDQFQTYIDATAKRTGK
jgi:hypothetical protein